MGERVLVVGAGGFVGSRLLQQLALYPDFVPIAGMRDRHSKHSFGFRTVELDVTSRDSVETALGQARPAIVINASSYGVRPAERDSEAALLVNAAGAMHLLEAAAAAGCRRFVQLGTCSEYGAREGCVHEDMTPTPNTIYGATKAAATLLVQERAASLGLDALVLRLFNIWGEGEAPHRLFPSIVSACRARRPLDLTDGRQVKDYSYVGDIARWIAALAGAPGPYRGRIVNVGSGRPMPLRDFVLQIAGRLGGAELMRFGAVASRAGEARTQTPDLGLLEQLLPNRRITPLEAALDAALPHGATASV